MSWTAWAIAAGGALLSGAWWLREPRLPYVVGGLVATGAAAWWAMRASRRGPRAHRWQWIATAFLAAFWVAAAVTERRLHEIDAHWSAFAADASGAAERAASEALDATAAALGRSARAALDAPPAPAGAFAHLAGIGSDADGEQGVVLYEAARPVAWAGRVRVSPDSLGIAAADSLGVVRSEFYQTAYAVARRGSRRAVALATLDAEPPADRFARTLVQGIAARGVAVVLEPGAGALGLRPCAVPPAAAEVRLHLVQRAKVVGAALLGGALLAFLVAAWRGRRLPRRLAALVVALAAVASARLSDLSGVFSPFDPSYYYAAIGGTLSANAGALILSGALTLVGLFAVLRASARLRSRRIASTIVLAVAGLGPFLLRDLASGITAPPGGVTTGLWLWWQLALFLAAVAVLLTGASAGRALLGPRRGIHPAVAPSLAMAAALLGPMLWQAPSRWPGWYPALWILAVGALALTRRTRGFVLLAAAVAGAGAATLTWGATARNRVALADRDVAALREVDPYMRSLAERLGDELAASPPESGRAALLQAYVASPLALAGFPAALTVWDTGGVARRDFAAMADSERPTELAALVRRAARSGGMETADVLGPSGAELAIAVPHPGGDVTTIVAAPRTRLTPEDPFATLYGFAFTPGAEPPYDVALTDASSPTPGPAPADGRWRREGDELHRDYYLHTSHGLARAHVEVALRSLDALGQRGALVILLDMAVVGLLWSLAALSDGPLVRWFVAWRRQWLYSYRARLSVALLGFFLVPAVAFAVWSYRRLQTDDRQARELLMRERLRSVAAGAGTAGRPASSSLARASVVTGTPMLYYDDGELRAASDSLYTELAPIGLFLDPSVYLSVAVADEVSASRSERLGAVTALFGYRAVGDGVGGRAVLGAPARTDEIALDRRSRDLGVLVLFSTVLGVVAAFWLSGVAARELARPIGRLRRSALALAAGEPEPTGSDARVPAEFEPVFSAFSRMARDLSASQLALEDAQRRTAAVLRNVASGVVAVDADGAVLLANPRAAALLDRPFVPGFPLDAWPAGEAVRRVRAFVASVGRDEEEFDEEAGDRTLHGRLTRLAAGGAVLTLDDLTEVARAQRVLAWGEMARQVAHEIKNPLTPIRLGVQHLKRARADGRPDFDRILDQNVGRILGEIDRLDEIARAFSRYGTAPAERPAGHPIDVAAVVRDVVSLEQMGEGSVRWELAGADAALHALADDEELREVLLNLLENARLAGASRVRVSLGRDGARAVLRVADDGQGIPDDVMPRIFEPHFSTRTSGSGLGLAISRRMIDGWGGEITVSSERGAGTEVTVRLVAA